MSDKVVKMNIPSNNAGHKGNKGSNSSTNKDNSKGSDVRQNRGKYFPRNREKGPGKSNNEQVEEVYERKPRNIKKGRLMNDFVTFREYIPQKNNYNHDSTKKAVSVYVKEDFVKASCQLIVKEGDWDMLTIIDSSVEWADVEQVCLRNQELPVCPICLYPPMCPLSPTCGHSMCYTCALRFVENCPDSSCPICHKAIIIAEMKPLKTFKCKRFDVGHSITLQLVNRHKNSNIVCPIYEQLITNVPNLNCDWGSKFCNIKSATPAQILENILLPQEEELQTQLHLLDDENIEIKPYIIQALTEIQKKKNECFLEMENTACITKNPVVTGRHNLSNGKKVFFYQSNDGQPIFLHPLNSRCLIHEYGSIELAPTEICCNIVAIEHFTQSPDLRSRYRYFSHLPLGSSFILCEVDITPFISPATYDHFKSDIERRAKHRLAKEHNENVYNNKVAKKEITYRCSAYLPQYTEVSKPSFDHFKTTESYDLLTSSTTSATGYSHLSFAEKLCAGASKSTPWINKTSHNEFSRNTQRYRIDSASSDISLDSGAHAPSFQASFSASLNDAFSNLDFNPDTVNPTPVQRKKKKKGKTISLTGGARRN